MTYVPPFGVVKERASVVGAGPKGRVNMSYGEFVALIKLMLRGVAIDEPWYLQQYPDVAEAVQAGTYRSARHHFIEEGYFEGRRPCNFAVDETWYLKTYPDVAKEIKSGAIATATDHFARHGYTEGRLPSDV